MRIKFSKSAIKFLEKQSAKNKDRIRLKIRALVLSLEEGIIPFKELDIKKLDGKWKGFLRMRIGNIRVIFRIDREKDLLFIYTIDFRGDVY